MVKTLQFEPETECSFFSKSDKNIVKQLRLGLIQQERAHIKHISIKGRERLHLDQSSIFNQTECRLFPNQARKKKQIRFKSTTERAHK